MRTPQEYDTANGKRYKVRYRSGGKQTSETFRNKAHAKTFAAILASGPNGVADALAWLTALEAGDVTPTFGEWFETYVDQLTGVTERTRADYRAQHRRYLSDLDPLMLPLITRSHVTDVVNRLDREGKSPKTIKNTIHMLSSAMALAIDEGHTTRNPCKRIRLPTARLDDHEVRFLTHDEARALLAAIPEWYRPFVAFLLGTGLRWSEATALQVRHVDLVAGTIRVSQAWKRIPGGFELGPPKSAKGNRTVNAAVLALVAVRPLVVGRKPRDYVFTATRGGVVQHSNFYNRIWQPACVSAGIGRHIDVAGKQEWDGPAPHDLRHTHASWLISDGISLEAIQDQLGHESIETTRRVYAKLLPAIGVAVGKAASAALDRALPDGLEGLPAPRVLRLEPGRGTDQAADA